MKKILKAEMWDKMQYLFRNYYDRSMHAVYYYDGTIDEEALKKVYDAILKKIPVLHSTFHNNFIRPYWTVNEDYTSADRGNGRRVGIPRQIPRHGNLRAR